jgi:hypothetical protein
MKVIAKTSKPAIAVIAVTTPPTKVTMNKPLGGDSKLEFIVNAPHL